MMILSDIYLYITWTSINIKYDYWLLNDPGLIAKQENPQMRRPKLDRRGPGRATDTLDGQHQQGFQQKVIPIGREPRGVGKAMGGRYLGNRCYTTSKDNKNGRNDAIGGRLRYLSK